MAALAAGAQFLPEIVSGIGAARVMRDKPKKTPAIPMPDEEMIRQNKRRSGPRRTGRASTILTGTEDGLGG